MKSRLGYSQRCVDEFMNAFCNSDRFIAPDARWDDIGFRVKTLRDVSSSNFMKRMDTLGISDLTDAQRKELEGFRQDKKDKLNKKKFSSDAMKRVQQAMRFKDRDGFDINNW